MILLLGKNGQVAHELQRSLAPLGPVVVASRQGEGGVRADLAAPASLRDVVNQVKPRLIVNAAAYTAVDAAEDDEAAAVAVNATAPGLLAELAQRIDATLIHYSTDYVFDGSASHPYTESSPTSPLGVYGRSKLEGERAIEQTGARHLILRTAWVYGRHGKNFFNTMRRLACEREELSIVNDQVGSPTWSRHIAELTAQLIAQGLRDADYLAAHAGVYHLTNSGQCSWYDFAKAIIEPLPAEQRRCQTIHPIPSEAYPTPAKRPAYSVLDNSKLYRTFGLKLPDWRVALHQCHSPT